MDAQGNKTGGRQKGTLNKDKQVLLDTIRERFPGYHPVIAMAEVANDESLDIALRFSAHKEIAQYVEPKRKAVETRMTIEGDVNVRTVKISGTEPNNA